jgi:hypothetical protein
MKLRFGDHAASFCPTCGLKFSNESMPWLRTQHSKSIQSQVMSTRTDHLE